MVATGAVIFAIFKRDPLHKDKLILFWLPISAIQCTTWSFLSVLFLKYYFRYENLNFLAISTLTLLVIWFITGMSNSYLQMPSIYRYNKMIRCSCYRLYDVSDISGVCRVDSK